jgi:GGDEF domain-containing protein
MIAPYLICVAGLFLAFHFHRGRPFFALTILIVAFWLMKTYLMAGIDGLGVKSLFHILIVFVPFNLMLLSVMREKGVFSDAARIRIVFLGLQLFLASFLHNNFTLVPIKNIFFSPFISNILSHSPIPQPVIVILGFELAIILIFTIVRQSPIDSGFFGATISFVAACNWIHDPGLFVAFSSASAAIITVSILQDSYNMAFRDELTGIPSRRAMNEQLHGIGRNYAIAMVDVDHFKKFNDTYGHDVGDQVLKLVAKKLTAVNGGGKAFRYGGEEFTIIFPHKKATEVLAHLEEIREAIATYKLYIRESDRPQGKREGKKQRGGDNNGISTSVTVSIGVADSYDVEMNKQEVIKAADKALYKAKNKGRNQVCK